MYTIAEIKEWAARPRTKKGMYALLTLVLVLWVAFRFIMVGIENGRYVFNPARDAAANGLPVRVITARSETGILHEPISIKNNRAWVVPARAAHFHAGQKVGNGAIVSVSNRIDFDTGMRAIRTRDVADGLVLVESEATGFFIPIDALHGDTVFVAAGDTARARQVTVARSDADVAVVTGGLNDGDVIVVSHVRDGQKIKIVQ